MWYSNNYRRHLIDMHIDDWDDSFMTEFSVEDYVKNLKLANVTNAMIYLQSHAGLCYYPTKSGVMHKAFVGREDTMRKLFDRCHEEGIAVTAYYSLHYNTREHDRHPEWRYLRANGLSKREAGVAIKDSAELDFGSAKSARYGMCCPNNPGYREFVYAQIEEMVELYPDIEGLFFDMPYWSGPCYCQHCQARFKAEKGYEMPKQARQGTHEVTDMIDCLHRWMGEWIQMVTDHVKKCAPTMSVEHNFAPGIAGESWNGCGEGVANASDFVGGDLNGGLVNQSLACKFYQNITKNAPFDYMCTRCKPRLSSHTMTKTEDEMKVEVMLTAAHHGASMAIDCIDPVGTIDERVSRMIGRVYSFLAPYEPYFKGKMVEDIGIYYSLRSRHSTYGEKFDNKTSSKGLTKKLVEANLPFGVTGNFHSIDEYKILILPMVTDFESDDVARIVSYVENGGRVFMIGATSNELLRRLLDAEFIKYTKEKSIYIAPTEKGKPYFLDFNKKYPVAYNGVAPVIKAGDNCEVLATLTLPYTEPDNVSFSSIHSDPPGRPTDTPLVIRRNVGKGQVIWSALPLESVETFDYEYGLIFRNLLLSLVPDYVPSFAGNAPEDVEVTLYDAGDVYTVNVCTIDKRPVARTYAPFTVKVKTDKKPEAVKLLPTNEDIPFTYDGEYVSFMARELNIFDMYLIEK